MANKYPGAGTAVGYWGRCGPWWRVNAEQAPERIRVLLQDKLITRGVPAWLYLPVLSTDPAAITCTCVKNTTSTSDRPCNECYGTGIVPGYRMFLHETVFAGVSEAGTFTLAGCSVDTKIKPHRILLNTGATSGTITTAAKPYSNTPGDDWTTNLDAFIRDTGNTVVAEFSTDGGTTWYSLALINGVNKPVGAGTLRFRITLTRTAVADKSPAFEIIRARHVRSADWNESLLGHVRPDMSAGQILVLRPWVAEQSSTDTGRGTMLDWAGDRSWTMPLDVFDSTLTANTATTKLDDSEAGPHPFYEYATGIKDGQRIAVTSVKWNEEFGVFTHQSFDERRVQTTESPYTLVF